VRGQPAAQFEPTYPQSETSSNLLSYFNDLPPSSIFSPSTQSGAHVPARAASPVKNMMDLEMGNPPITFLEDYKVSECPPAVNVLLSELLEASEGFGLLPWSLKVRFIL
jgi:hypothetical protein